MVGYMEQQRTILYDRANEVVQTVSMMKANRAKESFEVEVSEDFKADFFAFIDKVSLSLMEDNESFYGYFLFQMDRQIRFDMSTPTGINFKGAKYVMYFNPIIFLMLNRRQMETTIKHEIHHILSRHLVRARELNGRNSTLAINMAMDIVVNNYLDYLPPYATTLEQINAKYHFNLKSYEPFEYYVEKLQTEFDLMEPDEEGEVDDSQQDENVQSEYDVEKTHDLWDESDEVDEKTLQEFTERCVARAQKGSLSTHLESMIAALKNSKGEVPWNVYLNRLMGTIESKHKKTITRRNRRQPDRMDLRGTLRSHKAEIAVALDVSGSISDEEFKQAMKEVLSIIKNYNYEITIIECDDQIRRTYQVKKDKDIKERLHTRGATRFTPVFEYVNKQKVNLLVYFTDGKGEEKLKVAPRGYKVLWVISGRGDTLSLKESYGAVKKLSDVQVKDQELDMRDVRSDGYSMNHQESMF